MNKSLLKFWQFRPGRHAPSIAIDDVKIFFINLDRNPERRERLSGSLTEHQLKDISHRFPGTLADKSLNGLPLSVTGCLMSHLSLLQSLPSDDTTVILEDDACLARDFGTSIGKVAALLENSDYEILFLGQTVLFKDAGTHALINKTLQRSKALGKRQYLEASTMYRYGAFGYVVSQKAVDKIKTMIAGLDLHKEAAAIDVLFGEWLRSKRLRGAIALPYLVGVDTGAATTMHDRDNALEHRLQCELVNIYMDCHRSDAADRWEATLANSPNEQALAVCHALYRRITQHDA